MKTIAHRELSTKKTMNLNSSVILIHMSHYEERIRANEEYCNEEEKPSPSVN
jgi:hypothetical protein